MPAESFAVSGPIRTSLHLAVGDVTVTTDESGHASATVDPAEPGDRAATALAESATITFEGGELRVVVPDRVLWRSSPATLKVHLTVPTGSSLSAAAGVLTLTSSDRLGAVALKTGVATVDLDHADSLSLRGGTADVDLASAGDVSAKCGRADLRLGAVADVFVKVGQGTVEIGSCTGEVVVKGAMVGLDVAAASSGQIRFDAAMGSGTVGVAEGTTVQLDLSSATGDARSELSAPAGGRVDGADLSVRMRTTSGDVVVRRAVAEPSSAAS